MNLAKVGTQQLTRIVAVQFLTPLLRFEYYQVVGFQTYLSF